MTSPNSTPLSMRHAKRQAHWAIARFGDGGFALYQRVGSGGLWSAIDHSRPDVRVCVGTIYRVA